MGTVENVGVIQVIYTVEPDAEDESRAVVNYWLQDGTKIGSMSVPRGDGK